ncbi:uncharacterized protein LOC144877921 [Branchiostoma floridae x Branchiostoma japonicum]
MNEGDGSPTPPPQGGTSPTPPPQGGTSPTPSMMDQIRVSMQQNMSQLLQKAEQEEERWRNKIASFEAEMQENINSFLDERSTLEAKVESLECALYDKQQHINSLLQEIDSLEERVESMEHGLCDRRQDINMLVEENNTLEDKVESMECTLEERQQNINSLQQENDMLQDKVKDLEHTLYERQQSVNNLLQVKGNLEAKVQDLEQTCALYEKQENIKSLQHEKSKLDAKVEDLECKMSEREQNINSLLQENNMLQAKVQDLEHTLHERQQSINRFQNSNDMLQDKVENLEETLYERQQNINSFVQENNMLQDKVEDLKETLYERRQIINSLLQVKSNQEAKVQDLEHTLRNKQQNIESFRQENNNLLRSKWDLRRTLHESSYTMRIRQKNGRALIISNTQFTELRERTGAEGDPQKLAEAFRSLPVDIEVKTRQNLDLSTMQHVLREEANRDHTDEDFFICSIMTHGAQGKVFATDGFSADLLDILSLFNGKRCPSLKGKPKLFFIQACQGDRRQTAVEIAGAQDSDANPSPIQAYFSTEADFFLALATVPGYVAYRRDDGADFVNILAKVLKEQGKSQDLMSMMATISKELNAKYEYSPFCCTTLRHKLFFKLYAHTWNHLPTCTCTLYPTIETPNHGLEYRTRPHTVYTTTGISNYRVEFRPELTYPLRLPALYPTRQ